MKYHSVFANESKKEAAKPAEGACVKPQLEVIAVKSNIRREAHAAILLFVEIGGFFDFISILPHILFSGRIEE
ncbi:hypothetical protein D3C71_2204660 [compost metagenome]